MRYIKSHYISISIYIFSLIMLWSVTLQSRFLIGTDIHLEYHFLHLSQINGWDYSIPVTYNGSIPLVFIAPIIANILHIDGLWLLKIVFPMIFAIVPVLLYSIYKEYFTEKVSLLAVFFFISMPAFFMEISGNAKQMIGETLLVVCLYLILKNKKLWMILTACILIVLSHYTIAFILLFILIVGIIILLIKRQNVTTLLIASSTIAIVGFFYYSWVGGGILMHVLNSQLPINVPYLTVLAKDINTPETVLPITIGNDVVKMALGSDFLNVSNLGKMFRIVQYTTQGFIIVGILYLITRWNKSLLFMAFFIAGICLLGLWVLIPTLSGVIDVPRLYHVVLIILSPSLVVGGQYIFKNLKVVAVILAVYFIFTSGIVYEISKHETMDIPYSVAFSNYRQDLGGSITQDDIIVRDIIKNNSLTPVYADWYGLLLLHERFGVGVNEIALLPQYIIPKGSYIFLRSRNNQEQSVVLWSGVGQRKYYSYDSKGLELDNLVYRSGDASLWQI